MELIGFWRWKVCLDNQRCRENIQDSNLWPLRCYFLRGWGRIFRKRKETSVKITRVAESDETNSELPELEGTKKDEW